MLSQRPKFSFPLSNKGIREGLKEDAHKAIHWLSWWCLWKKERERFWAKLRKF